MIENKDINHINYSIIERRIILKKRSILFYILAVIFLAISIYMGVSAYFSLAESAAQYDISLIDEWSTVLQNIFAAAEGFFAFACILCGIAMILGNLPGKVDDIANLKKKKIKRQSNENSESKKDTAE